jgi:general secretion pathway protein B
MHTVSLRLGRAATWCLLPALAGLPLPAAAQDTPEMLAAMRSALPPVPADVPAWESLPADMRRQMPAFDISAHRWHADPAQTFVLIDGRRVEPDGVAGRELWLREVREDGVVMQFRDQIFFCPR